MKKVISLDSDSDDDCDIEIKRLNGKIAADYCDDVTQQLSDLSLLSVYKQSKSVKDKLTRFQVILKSCYVDDETSRLVLDRLLLEIIPAGTKGVIRGNKFNHIVKSKILSMKLPTDEFDVAFEVRCEQCPTDEKPDWFIRHKSSKRVIVGMNQLDLWSGGAQSNRGKKYLIGAKQNTHNTKLLCVVSNFISLSHRTSEAFKLFKTGFENNTLCYISTLPSIIRQFFELPRPD